MRTLLPSLLLVTLLAGGCAAGAPPTATLPGATPTAAPTATPPPTVAPALIEAMEMRRSFGLRWDLPWVTQVEGSGDAVMSELGFLVTPAEAAELERRFASQDSTEQLNAYGAANPDQFAGLYIDQAAGGVIVMLFTADHDRHADAIATLVPPSVRVQIRPARFTEAQLTDVLENLDFDALAARGYELNSAGIDTINNVVRLEAKSNVPNAKALLEAQFGGLLVADIFPLPGPWANTVAGEGWRLLGSGIGSADTAYSVQAAVDEAAWTALRARLDTSSDMAEPDLAAEIVVVFAHGIGSSCREVRLDDVAIDGAQAVVYSITSDPLAPRNCTADLAGAALFVVALQRESLPDSPFAVQLAADPITGGGFPERIEIDLGD